MNIVQMLSESNKFIYGEHGFEDKKNELLARKKIEDITKDQEAHKEFLNGGFAKDKEVSLAISILNKLAIAATNPLGSQTKDGKDIIGRAKNKEEAEEILRKLFQSNVEKSQEKIKPYLAVAKETQEELKSGKSFQFIDDATKELLNSPKLKKEEPAKEPVTPETSAEEPAEEPTTPETAADIGKPEKSGTPASEPASSSSTTKSLMNLKVRDARVKADELYKEIQDSLNNAADKLRGDESASEWRKRKGEKIAAAMKEYERYRDDVLNGSSGVKETSNQTSRSSVALAKLGSAADKTATGISNAERKFNVQTRKSGLSITADAIKKKLTGAGGKISSATTDLKNKAVGAVEKGVDTAIKAADANRAAREETASKVLAGEEESPDGTPAEKTSPTVQAIQKRIVPRRKMGTAGNVPVGTKETVLNPTQPVAQASAPAQTYGDKLATVASVTQPAQEQPPKETWEEYSKRIKAENLRKTASSGAASVNTEENTDKKLEKKIREMIKAELKKRSN